MQPREKDVVLKCGCIRTSFGAIRVLGYGYEEQSCETHDGWFRIIREASERDRIIFYILRKKVPSRATKQSLGELLRMSSGNSEHETLGNGTAQPTLF